MIAWSILKQSQVWNYRERSKSCLGPRLLEYIDSPPPYQLTLPNFNGLLYQSHFIVFLLRISHWVRESCDDNAQLKITLLPYRSWRNWPMFIMKASIHVKTYHSWSSSKSSSFEFKCTRTC